jgi:hypothetical protein
MPGGFVRGAFSKFLWQLPPVFSHEHHGNLEKASRYTIGESRLAFLKRHGEAFAYLAKPTGEQVVAFLVALDDDDRDPGMPDTTCYEYFAGSLTAEGSVVLYAYLWFATLADAKAYAIRHGMTLEGGWNK